MTLSRGEVVEGLVDELGAFGDLIGPLDEKAWAAPTRCRGWSVADVAAHVIGSMADVVSGRFEGLGSPEVTAREVAERKGRTPAELAAELAGVTKLTSELGAAFDDAAWAAPAPGGYDGTLGDGVEALWYDTYLHADDIRAALGRTTPPGPGLRASVVHVATTLEKRGWGPATLDLDGIEPVTVGVGGPVISGDPMVFVLAATGSGRPAGPGARSLGQHLRLNPAHQDESPRPVVVLHARRAPSVPSLQAAVRSVDTPAHGRQTSPAPNREPGRMGRDERLPRPPGGRRFRSRLRGRQEGPPGPRRVRGEQNRSPPPVREFRRSSHLAGQSLRRLTDREPGSRTPPTNARGQSTSGRRVAVVGGGSVLHLLPQSHADGVLDLLGQVSDQTGRAGDQNEAADARRGNVHVGQGRPRQRRHR